jgi:hypothetical protein
LPGFGHSARMTKYAGSLGDSFTSFNIFPWKLTTSGYVAKADFEHGSAQIKITLIKRNGAWRILGFYVQGKGDQERSAKWRMLIYLLFRPYFA